MIIDLSVLGSEAFSPAVAELVGQEIPDYDPLDPPFDFVFSTPQFREVAGHPFVTFGTTTDDELLGVRVADGKVEVIRQGACLTTYVNASPAVFLEFVARVGEYKKLFDNLNPDPAPWTLDDAETVALLQRFADGKVRPRTDRQLQQRNEATLRRELRTLRSNLRGRDPKALRPTNWWGRILFEYADAIP